uniref:Uncharacterized protein n=1 Tax=Nelumbo nucifera TaxID=4432 RepID=A0A822XRS0_NELNU|nr:TPA_asm: hypothetical protein HUJ06_023129 [Nelumbo nucifera]
MHVLAILCVEEQTVENPTMREVVQILIELPRPSNSKHGDSTIMMIESLLSLAAVKRRHFIA